MDDENTPPRPDVPAVPDTPDEPGAASAPSTDPAATSVAAAEKKSSKRAPIIAAVVAVVVLAAVGAGALVYSKLAGTGDVLVGKVPANSLVYATAYLDPAAQQKMNLQGLLEKFPALSQGDLGDNVDQGLNAILSGSGLNFEQDVKPWIGSQIGVAVTVEGGDPQGVFLIDATDADAASQALDKVKNGPDNEGMQWTQQEYKGTEISIGKADFQSDEVYGIVGNVVVLASDLDSMKAVIDASTGDSPNLGGSADYKATLKTLPEERLALAYVNIRSAIGLMKEAGGGSASGVVPLTNVDAFSGVGETLAAESDGLSIQVSAPVDVSKLPESAQAAFTQEPHQNATLAWTPSNAYGTLAIEGLDTQLKTLLDQGKSNPAFSSADQLLGISGALGTLTGDAGLEVTPGSGPTPTGALLLGTSDTESTKAFLDKLAALASSGIGGLGSGETAPSTTEDYNGVTIREFSIPDAPTGVEPAYAVTDGMVILGASPDAVKASIDAHSGGTSITTSSVFTTALGHVDAESNELFFVDLQAVATGVQGLIPPEAAGFGSEIAANLAPIKSIILTSTSNSNGQTANMFIVIT